MAFLDEDELIATIRHEMRIEDEAGWCRRLLPPVPRRAKHGGLPIDFRTDSDDSDECEENPSPDYEIPTDLTKHSSTRNFIEGRLRALTADSDQMRFEADGDIESGTNAQRGSVDGLFQPRTQAEIEEALKRRRENESVLSRHFSQNGPGAMRQTTVALDAALRACASIEVDEADAAKPSVTSLLILYLNKEEQQRREREDQPFSIKIRVKRSARISEITGLACLKYAEARDVRIETSPDDLALFIAEENGEVDEDFPPLDRQTCIGDVGFRVLALRERPTRSGSGRPVGIRVLVYLPNGDNFAFELPHLEQPLRWLRDEAVKRRVERMSEAEKSAFEIVPDYHLEHIDQADQPIDLAASIASTGCTEFVLVRKNSSRGGFHPRPKRLPSLPSMGGLAEAVVSQISPVVTLKTPGFSFDFSSTPTSSVACPLAAPSSSLAAADGLIEEFRVDRLHKYKPRWPARLSIRWNCIEVSPWSTERRLSNKFGKSKTTNVMWEDVCDVRFREKKHPTGGGVFGLVTLTWLPPPLTPPTTPLAFAGTTREEQELVHLSQRSRNDTWKWLQLESMTLPDAEQIVALIERGLRDRNSAVVQAYAQSSGGQLKPSAAAAAALGCLRQLSSPVAAPQTPSSGGGNSGGLLLPPGASHRKRNSIIPFLKG